jgi:hypothetical protein
MAEVPLSVRLRAFKYFKVTQSTSNTMALVRGKYFDLATWLVAALPDSRERSLALTALEESLLRANQCLAVLGEGSVAVEPSTEDEVTSSPDKHRSVLARASNIEGT